MTLCPAVDGTQASLLGCGKYVLDHDETPSGRDDILPGNS